MEDLRIDTLGSAKTFSHTAVLLDALKEQRREMVSTVWQLRKRALVPKTSRGLMHQDNVGVPYKRIAIDIKGPCPESENGNRHLLIAMEHLTKRPEVYVIPNQEASAMVHAPVTTSSTPSVSREWLGLELLMQEVLERLRTSNTRTTLLHTQSDGMVGRYVKTVEEHLTKVFSAHQRDWDERLPMFLWFCCLMSVNPWDHKHDARQHGVRERAAYPVTYFSGLPPTKGILQPTTWWTS
jgi:hypothetical protein